MSNIIGDAIGGVVNFVGSGIAGIGEGIANGVKEVGKSFEKVGETFDSRKQNEVNFRNATDSWKNILNIGGGIAGALGGWKLGENFGPIGKVIGCVGLGIIGTKLGGITQEVGTDIAAAQDYSREAEAKGAKGNFGKALWNNLINFGGQTYDGAKGSEATAESDGPDV